MIQRKCNKITKDTVALMNNTNYVMVFKDVPTFANAMERFNVLGVKWSNGYHANTKLASMGYKNLGPNYGVCLVDSKLMFKKFKANYRQIINYEEEEY